MSDSLAKSIEVEIAQLRQSLRDDPRVVKINALEEVLRLYRIDNPSAAPARSQPKSEVTSRGRSMKPERAEALKLAKEYLARNPGRPIKTAEIYEHIEFCGHSLPGQNPSNNLASLLIRSGEIQSHGRAGWTLAEPETLEASDNLLSGPVSEASNSSDPDQADNPTVRPVDPVPGGGT